MFRLQIHGFWLVVLLLFLLHFCPGQLIAQVQVVTGTIRDNAGNVLPGVDLRIKGSTKGAVTNLKGIYSIKAGNNDTLIISFVGFASEKIFVGNRNEIDVVLTEKVQDIGEIVITALYGSRGGFGVINITTKKGTSRKGVGIEYSSNYVFEKVINYLDLQSQYGQGNLAYTDPGNPNSPMIGSKPASQEQAFYWGTSSWGAKLDGNWNIMWDGGLEYKLYNSNYRLICQV